MNLKDRSPPPTLQPLISMYHIPLLAYRRALTPLHWSSRFFLAKTCDFRASGLDLSPRLPIMSLFDIGRGECVLELLKQGQVDTISVYNAYHYNRGICLEL